MNSALRHGTILLGDLKLIYSPHLVTVYAVSVAIGICCFFFVRSMGG
jgi:hypothetical protein